MADGTTRRIMVIDVAPDLERREGRAPHEAIRTACLQRLRPILTLYTTPIVYLFLERWRLRSAAAWGRFGEHLGIRRTAGQISGGSDRRDGS